MGRGGFAGDSGGTVGAYSGGGAAALFTVMLTARLDGLTTFVLPPRFSVHLLGHAVKVIRYRPAPVTFTVGASVLAFTSVAVWPGGACVTLHWNWGIWKRSDSHSLFPGRILSKASRAFPASTWSDEFATGTPITARVAWRSTLYTPSGQETVSLPPGVSSAMAIAPSGAASKAPAHSIAAQSATPLRCMARPSHRHRDVSNWLDGRLSAPAASGSVCLQEHHGAPHVQVGLRHGSRLARREAERLGLFS